MRKSSDFQRLHWRSYNKDDGLVGVFSSNFKPIFSTCTVFRQPRPLPKGAFSSRWQLNSIPQNGRAKGRYSIFFYRIVTMDETWVHHSDPEMKSSSIQWKTPSFPTPMKARVESSCGLSPIRSHITLKYFWRSKKGGRNVSICRVTVSKSNKMWCKFQLSSLIPSKLG